ncbi:MULTISPECIES: glycosyltransferase family 9 protein [Niastella]|uniref:Glycosyltransferase family 9 protein n=1 Tax=Niastella soli TaxID=2821487 RepID=A0ABS3YUJ3_9BACT|nr:glycosyltransferase family 9 protein [Niastella soli]MBO9201555.1 glycosyltransferase family 9 protein [Niastella soli]
MKQPPLRVIVFGGLGDVLITTPTFKAIKEASPHRKIILYCFTRNQQSIFRNNPHIHRVTSTSFWRNPISFIKYYLKMTPFFDDFYAGLSPTVTYNKNAKDIIAEMYGIELKDDKVQVFLSPEEESFGRSFMSQYNHPILLHVTSRTSQNQEWPHANWDELVQSMPGFTFLQIGLNEEKKVESAVDLRSKHSIRETLAIMKYARSFVGVNSAYAHATNAFEIPGVVLFGPAQPVIWGHSNNINLYKPLRCSPCLDLMHTSPCPYDRRCMHDISVAEVRAALLQQLEKDTLSLA